jgi:hypothetical protein
VGGKQYSLVCDLSIGSAGQCSITITDDPLVVDIHAIIRVRHEIPELISFGSTFLALKHQERQMLFPAVANRIKLIGHGDIVVKVFRGFIESSVMNREEERRKAITELRRFRQSFKKT